MRSLNIGVLAGLVLLLTQTGPIAAQTAAALSGQISSADEGPMEGVLVSAKRAGSTITVTVVSDAQGRYSFPTAKLEPGQYTLRIRAAGYDLDHPALVDVNAPNASTADLKLRKTEDLASQLSNGEWIASVPGSDQQKSVLLNCMGCHTLERIVKSTHTADEFMQL